MYLAANGDTSTVSGSHQCSTLAKGTPVTTVDDLACQDGTHLYAATSLGCIDGRRLGWSDYAWGYTGQSAHLFAAGVTEHVAPEAERNACTVAPTTTTATTVAPPSTAHPPGTTGLCEDGTHTAAKHSQGACSYHGGIAVYWG